MTAVGGPRHRVRVPARLEELQPFIGPCAICGGPDKRHRLWDAVRDRLSAGASVEDAADDYGLTPETVALILALPTRRKRWRELQAVPA